MDDCAGIGCAGQDGFSGKIVESTENVCENKECGFAIA